MQPVAVTGQISVGLQIAQYRAESPLVQHGQFRVIREACAISPPADAAQYLARHFVLAFAERDLEARGVVVQMGGSARPRKAFPEASFNLSGGDAGGIASADIAKRGEEKLYVVGNGVLQQIEHPGDGAVIEREIATTQRGQEVGGDGPVPRVQMERCEVIKISI